MPWSATGSSAACANWPGCKLEGEARPGHDYVLIGRAPTFARSFPELEKDLTSALKRLHRTAHLPADKGTS